MKIVINKKPFSRYILLLLGLVNSIGISYAEVGSAQGEKSNAILLQGFHWNSKNYDNNWYAQMEEKVPVISELGVTHVWFPPPSDSTSTNGYLPRQLNILSSYYGTESDLTSAVSAFKKVGINSVVDVVINRPCRYN